MADSLIIVGASVRAAACSAVRAGYRPIAFDLFGDRDLRAVAPTTVIPGDQYPDAIPDMLVSAPPGPVMYTGALENRPDLIEWIGRTRQLIGNGAQAVRRVRDPFALAAALQSAGLPCPNVSSEIAAGRWLSKPLQGAGGRGIGLGKKKCKRGGCYFQEFIEGEPRAGVFVVHGSECELLGVTRQLVGETWLHAPRFGYCGSIGPLELSLSEQTSWQALGNGVAQFGRLSGVFGIDAIVRDGVPWPVEVNPRYTASVEVVEHGTGRSALAPSSPIPFLRCGRMGSKTAKGVYYAPRDVVIPDRGPWTEQGIDRFADIPRAGDMIRAKRPVISIFAHSVCELRGIAQSLDRMLESEYP